MNNSIFKKEKKENFNKAQLEVCPGVKRYVFLHKTGIENRKSCNISRHIYTNGPGMGWST